jgi:hypothetical protein
MKEQEMPHTSGIDRRQPVCNGTTIGSEFGSIGRLHHHTEPQPTYT